MPNCLLTSAIRDIFAKKNMGIDGANKNVDFFVK
jgi:hypothetical protein